MSVRSVCPGWSGPIEDVLWIGYLPYARSDKAQKEVKDWDQAHFLKGASAVEKLKMVLEKAADKLPEEIGKQVRDMLSPENVGIFGGVMLASGIASFTPGANFVVGGLIATLGYLLFGKAAFDISRDLYMGVTIALDAQTQQDVDEAADKIASGLSTGLVAAGGAAAVKLGVKLKNAKREPKSAKEALENVEIPKDGQFRTPDGRLRNADGTFALDPAVLAPKNGNPLRRTGADSGRAVGGGQGLGKLAGQELKVTQAELAEVEAHLMEFAKRGNGGVHFPENEMMLQRLRDALQSGKPISGAELAFYTHELHELKNMSQLLKDGRTFDEAYNIAHKAALDAYGNSPFSVYHPDVIKVLNAQTSGYFNSNWLKFWGIE